MQGFRYDTSGTWYKGNTHIHTQASDGGHSAPEVAAMYASAGYDFLFRTDHWVASDVEAEGDDGPLLWLDGTELDGTDDGGRYYHVVCLGRFTGITRALSFSQALEVARGQGGLLIVAHPHWSGNGTPDMLHNAFHGVEGYNHVCQWLNGKGDGRAYWSALAEREPSALSFAADDAHLRSEHPGWNGGWIVVNAPQRSRQALMAAVWAGNFYASTGPEFHSLVYEDGTVTAETSPVQFARLVGPASVGQRVGNFEGTLFSHFSFKIPSSWAYAYLEIEDGQGRRAWTNALLI